MSQDFYIFLSSNVNTGIGIQNNNTISNFVTHLPQKLKLDDTYEVGIADISFTKSWFNINEPQLLTVTNVDTKQKIISFGIYLPAGDYISEETLVTYINKMWHTQMESEKEWVDKMPLIFYDTKSNKFKIDLGVSKSYIIGGEKIIDFILPTFSQELSDILGFSDDKLGKLDIGNYKKFTPITDGKAPRIEGITYPILNNIHTLYVYSDILRPRIVGNTMAPLFRQVEVKTGLIYGQDSFVKYKKRFYHPLNHFEIDSVQIVIKDDTGKEIDFKVGRVTLSLHFRKKISKYF